MNIREVQDRLIGAECVIRELAESRVGPQPLRAQQLPYLHSRTDMNGWGKKPGEKDKLLTEDGDAHALYRREFWEQFHEPPSSTEISEAHQILDWVMLVEDDAERRALRAWAYAMAGGRPFARWCKRVEKISVMTGRRRKNRAVEQILAKLGGKGHLHDEMGREGVLPVTPEFDHVSDTVAVDASGEETGLNSWWSDDAFQPIVIQREVINDRIAVQSIPVSPQEFSWAAKRNERRRQREAAKRKEQAKRSAA